MIPSVLSRLVILIFGTLYPAYSSYKAVRTKNVREYVKWMMYWIVFALFTCAETFTDIFLSFWFPFYYEFKIILVVYLLSPATNGSSILYRKFVHPALIKREQEIDEYISKAMEQGYHTVLNLGSKSVAYATSVLMQTAIRSGGGLVNHIKKSYSLDDINTKDQRSRKEAGDDVDGREEDQLKLRRKKTYSPRRTISAGSHDLYFPEIEEYKRSSVPIDRSVLSHIRSSEDISSGYSSTEPLSAGSQYDSKDNLLRTASMGPTTRTRTRLAKKTISEVPGYSATLPKPRRSIKKKE
ncbi:UNVERIFIED_CONTAM: hypothetical protein PYX00_007523 [Menopon gallinae]|uniref:Receptor expression-enhancing protein n=1 Tax=Menopon gallinae TaxID=328185 RepID=A0AAW2HKD2_9NEOP